MPFTLIGQVLRNFIFGAIMCKLIPYAQGIFIIIFFCILFLASKSRLANAKEFFTLHVCIYIIKLNIAIGIFELPEKVDPRSVKLLNQKPRMNIP